MGDPQWEQAPITLKEEGPSLVFRTITQPMGQMVVEGAGGSGS